MALSKTLRNALLGLVGLVVAAAVIFTLQPQSADAGHHMEASREQIALELIAKGALVVDVRRTDEFSAGHLDGAIHIPHDETEARLAEYGADKSRDIVVYCRSGRRSGIATEILRANGFTNVHNGGGFEPIKAAKS